MKGNFQIIILIVFVALAVLGVLVFAGVIPLGSSNNNNKPVSLGTVVIWGTVSGGAVSQALADFNTANPTFVVRYVQKNTDILNQDLLEALVAGRGPDMFLLPDNLILSYKNRIYPISYQNYSLASFKNTFIGAGEALLTSNGILAFPIAIDPLMMYYNRSILDQNAIIFPPKYWDDFQGLIPILTKKDVSNKITQSTVALGQFSNITNAKDILTTLFMQTGNSIITENNGYFTSALNADNKTQNLASFLSFYLGFSDPAQNVYSWNRGLPNSTDAFSAENLVFYFGYASELPSLARKNPNENFLVAPVPQIKNNNFKLTSGHVLGLAVATASKNRNLALTAATLMTTSGGFANQFAKAAGIVPVRRDLLAQKPTDAYFPIFYDSALYAKSWLDPSPVDTDNIFQNMIDKVLSNSMTPDNAIRDANAKMTLLLN